MRATMVLVMVLAGCGNNNSGESCTQAVCPLGGHTYRFCSAAGAASCRYIASDGKVFPCSSCSTCTSAASAVASWCSNDPSSNNNINAVDLGTKKNPDLAQAPYGCSGFDNCLTICSQNNANDPTGYTNCANDCAAQSTDNAISLWVDAYFVCPGTAFCGPGKKNDAGVQPCSAADLDPNGDTVSDACNECLNNAYRTMSSAIMTTCKSQITSCNNDLP